MKLKLFTSAALLILGSAAAHAQVGYVVGDLIATFENPAGNDLQINLGLESTLAVTPGGVTDFGNVSTLLTSAGLTTSSPFSVIGAIGNGPIKGGPTTVVPYAQGTITALPQTLLFTQNNGATPDFLGSPAAVGTTVYNAVSAVGGDAGANSGGGVGLGFSIVNAAADSTSYSNNIPQANFSNNLQTTAPGAKNELYLLTSQIPGTTGKSGVSEGPYTGAFDLGSFSVSNTGELTFTAIPEPSTYAAILGALTLGVAAFRRRRSAVV